MPNDNNSEKSVLQTLDPRFWLAVTIIVVSIYWVVNQWNN